MDKKITNYIRGRFIIVAFLCIVLFVSMSIFMSYEAENMADEVSKIYFSEINSQMKQKFDIITSLRAEQLENLIERTSPDDENWREELTEGLRISAGVSDFMGLGMYRNDGKIEMINGEKVVVDKPLTINCNCDKQLHMIQLGYNESGEEVLILGMGVGYPMSDGKESDALFAVLPFEYFNEAMYLDVPETRLTTHIIDSDGNYLIKNGDAKKYDNVYERIKYGFLELNEKTPDDYVKELEVALHNDDDYATRYKADGETRRMYISKLNEGLEWYAMTVMPDLEMSNMLKGIYSNRNIIMFSSVIVIIILMSWVFYGYYKLSKQQMRELHKARTEADKANAAKSLFLTSMSHDIRTPMNAIIGMSDIAIKHVDDPEKTTECLKKVQLSSKHLLGLINDVLDMSSIESGKLTIENRDVALHQLTSECVDIIQPQIKAKKQLFDVYIGDIIFEHIYSDGVRLSQVLLNLLTNATKYTPEGGHVYLHIYQEESKLGEHYVRTIFEVEDNGIGMSEEFLLEIFNRFSREDTETVRNISGSGLGMAITKSIVDMMGGTIDVQSKVDEGTRFTVTLDVKKADVEELDMKLPPWKVLVVDDNEQLCQSATDTLAELGLQAEWTLDGMEAIKMVEEHHNKKDDYHFALIDWKMPNMDGVQTIRELRKKVKVDIPVFIISAYNQDDVENVLQDTEIAGFISKPLFKSNLYEHFIQYIDNEAVANINSIDTSEMAGKRLLLAEDNDINWEIVYEVLAEYDIQVDRAENGRDCVEMFEKAEIGYYSAVLMDVHMPIMDGYEATRTIRAMDRRDSNVPIIAMTADVFSDNIQRCKESGMDASLTKPLDVKECLRTLKKYI